MEKRAQMEQARSFAQVLQNEAALQMQREADENPPYFMPSGSSSHKPTKKTKTLECRAMPGTGRGRGKGRGQGKSAPTPTLNELLEKLNRAKRIESSEEVPDVPGEEPEVESGIPVLGLDQNLEKSGQLNQLRHFLTHHMWFTACTILANVKDAQRR